MDTPATAYKILTADEWAAFDAEGRFAGAPVDLADGYIHLSTAAQLGETRARHFAGRDGLVLAEIDLPGLGEAVRWEPSRGGQLFPHVYGVLERGHVRDAVPMPPPALTPVALKGRHVSLVPLSPDHHDGLVDAVRDGEVWQLWYTLVPAPGSMAGEIERRRGLWRAGSMLPFTVIDGQGRIAGMTTFMNVDAATPRVEIGSTWYRAGVRRTGLNTEAKRLLLGHAFDTLGCPAVEFRTHVLNQESRAAIERLGARLDGILRGHLRMADGSLRDTCVYSIVASEWPAVRNHLDWQLARPR